MASHADEPSGEGKRPNPSKGRERPRGQPVKIRRWTGIERALRQEYGPLLAGIDEVGRGPLAGPVVACAVVMPPDARAIRGVDDSKQLTRQERERLAHLIRARALAVGLGAASRREIDRLNVFQATVLAMRRALSRLSVTPDHVVLDGLPLRTLGVAHRAVVGGDARCYSIACASIVAKVTRDRVMRALGLRHPEYHWSHNVGYATAAHLAGIDRHGITPHHRRRFWRVAQTMLALGDEVVDLAQRVDAEVALTDAAIEEGSLGELEVDEVGRVGMEAVRLEQFEATNGG